MFVLEDAEHAAARGAAPWRNSPAMAPPATPITACRSPRRRRTGPGDRTGAGRCRRRRRNIDYVNLHGTSTELNDVMETAAMKKCFGAAAPGIPMSSTKSMIGHPQGAAAQRGWRRRCSACSEGFVHPTINLAAPDPPMRSGLRPQPTPASQIECGAVQLHRLRQQEQRSGGEANLRILIACGASMCLTAVASQRSGQPLAIPRNRPCADDSRAAIPSAVSRLVPGPSIPSNRQS